MVDGQPADEHLVVVRGDRLGRVAHALGDDPLVVEQVAVGDHDTARGGGRTGGVLEERDGVRGEFGLAPGGGRVVGYVLGGGAGDPVEFGQMPGHAVERGHDVAAAQDDLGVGVGHQALHPGQRAVVLRAALRGHARYGDHTGREAAQIGADELRAGRVQQHRARAGQAALLQPGGDGPGASGQPVVGEFLDLPVAVTGHEVPVRGALGMVRGVLGQ